MILSGFTKLGVCITQNYDVYHAVYQVISNKI